MRNNFEKKIIAGAVLAVLASPGQAQEGNSDKKILEKETNKIEAQAVVKEVNKKDTYYAAVDFYKVGEGNKEKSGEKSKESGVMGKVSDAKPLEVKVINNIENNSRIAQLEVGNYFATDLAEVTPENKKVIEDNIRNILSQIKPENVEDFIKAEKKIYVASDERETNNWGGSNENLSIARGEVIKKILEEIFKSYKYNENLSLDNIKQLETSSFIIEPFVSKTGQENGVIYLTDVENPETPGRNFTVDDVKKLELENPVLYKKLLDNNRKVIVAIGVRQNLFLLKINPDIDLKQPSPELAGVPTFEIPSETPSEIPTVVKHKPTKESHNNFRVKKFHMPEKYKAKKCVSPKSKYKKHR